MTVSPTATKVPCCPAASKGFQGYYCTGHPRNGSNLTATADADISSTLADIGVEYADLILLHWPCETVEDTWATYKALEGALTDGRARAIGLPFTAFSLPLHYHYHFTTISLPFHRLSQRSFTDLRSLCFQIPVISERPL